MMQSETMTEFCNPVATDMTSATSQPLVVGMGVTGVSIAGWLARQHRSAVFADSRADAPGAAMIATLLPEAELRCGTLPGRVPPGVDEILLSPGLPLDLPLLQDAAARCIPVYSDIDVFMRSCGGTVIAVTGSNGKSTVTSLLGSMLRAAAVPVAIGGNLGTAALDLLQQEASVFVLELSSFQLERSHELPVHAAVVLNLSPDHLDHHGSLTAYAAAKSRIYLSCRYAVVNRDEPLPMLPAGIPVTGFTLGKPASMDWGVIHRDDGQWIARGTYPVMPVKNLQLAGRHNLQNVLAAFAMADTLELSLDGLIAGAQVFTGLPHRMQRIASADGITWIDDSKATNEAAAIASIESVTGRMVLIAGGDAKGAELRMLARCLEDKDVLAILLGRDREMLHARLQDVCEVQLADTMADAVAIAAAWARPGDTVLLAPACSSLDMYRNYGERGDAFANAVREVQS